MLTACAVNYIHGKNIRFAAPTMNRGLDLWAYANGVTLDFSRPGKLTDNAFIGAFKGTVQSRMSQCVRISRGLRQCGAEIAKNLAARADEHHAVAGRITAIFQCTVQLVLGN